MSITRNCVRMERFQAWSAFELCWLKSDYRTEINSNTLEVIL